MSGQETSDGQNDPNKDIPLPKLEDQQNTNIDKERNEADDKEEFKISIQKPKKCRWKTGDYINLGMMIFTALLFGITTYSTYLTKNTIKKSDSTNSEILNRMKDFSDASKQSATANEKVADATIKADSISNLIMIDNRDVSKFNRGSVEDENRAFIVLDSIRLRQRIVGEVFGFYTYVTNVGKTAAYNMRGSIYAIKDTSNRTMKKYFVEIKRNIKIVTKIILGASKGGSFVTQNIILSKEFNDSIMQGNANLFFIGEIIYDDVYKHHHIKHIFCQYDFITQGYAPATRYNDEN